MNTCSSISIAQHGEIIIIISSIPWSQNLSLRDRVHRVRVLRVRVLRVRVRVLRVRVRVLRVRVIKQFLSAMEAARSLWNINHGSHSNIWTFKYLYL